MSIPFGDPAGWGFCQYCAFQVAVDTETGLMLVHERRAGDWAFHRCYGSLMEPTEQTSPEMTPVPWEKTLEPQGDDEEENDSVVLGTD